MTFDETGTEAPESLAFPLPTQGVPWDERDMFVIHDAEDLLFVESGAVDLFAVLIRDGRPAGPWHSLARLTTGDVVVGPVFGPRHRVLCRRVGHASMRSVNLAGLRQSIGGMEASGTADELIAILAEGIDSSLRKIDRSLGRPLAPRDFSVLQADASCEFGRGDILRPTEALLWVEIVSGHVFQGHERAEFQDGEHLCLTRQDWLSLDAPSVLRTRHTHDLLRQDHLWHRLVGHWSRFLYQVDRTVEREASVAEAAVRIAQDRDRSAQVRVRNENDALLLEGTTAPVTATAEGVTPGLVDAAVRVLTAMKENSSIPPHISHARDISDYDDLGSSGWVRTRAIRLEGRWWTTDMGPVAGFWGPDHLPVSFQFHEGGYVVFARWLDRPVRVTRDNQFSAGRHVWAVYPRLPAAVTTVGGLIRYGFVGLRSELWLFGAMAALIGLIGLLTPILNGKILGEFVASANRPMIIQGGIAVIASALVAAAFSIVQNLAVLRLQGALIAKTQVGVWSRLLDLPVTFFQRYSTGRLGTIVLSMKSAQEVLSGVVVAGALGLVVVIANLAVVFFFNVQLALAGVALAAVACAVCWLAGRRVLRLERARYDAEQKLTGMSFEVLSAMTKIRAAAAEERAFVRWSDQQRVVQAHVLASRRAQDQVTVFNGLYPLIALGLVFTLANFMEPPMPLPALLSFLTAFTLMINALLQFTGSVLTAGAIVPMVESLAPILSAEPEAGVGKAHPGELSGNINLRGISFRYGEDGPLVLDDVSLDVQPGEFVAIVGPSGSGKSTIIRLMLGFSRPIQGAVLYDGQDLGELDLPSVRAQCGVVLQAGNLMPGDIRDNISGGGRFSEDEIWEAADMAGLTPVIKSMPMGLATVVNEAAAGLSGGQIQRLMIARALVNRPRFVIFDEATSALDNPTQQIVAEATRQLNATRIVVAHRLSTVRDADRIVVMDKGTIVQVGSYDELMAEPDGLFAELARRQEAD